MKNNIINFQFGDYSGDGHGKQEKVLLETELSTKDFEKYLDLIKPTLGLNFGDTDSDLPMMLNDYECHEIPEYGVKILKDLGCPWALEEDSGIYSSDEFVELIIFCVKETHEKITGNDIFLQQCDEIPTVSRYWGYGIFE